MLKSLRIEKRNPYNGELLGVVMLDPTTRTRVSNIDGLGPVKNEFSQAPRAAQAGSIVTGKHDMARTIIITLDNVADYADDYSVSDVRRNTTSILLPGDNVLLIFELDDLMVSIEGLVETNDTPMFARESRSTITIFCEWPYFKRVGAPEVVVWTPQTPVMEFEYRGRSVAPVGFLFESTLVNTPTTQTPHLRGDGTQPGSVLIDGYNFLADDTIKINSIRGQRKVSYIRSAGETSVLGFMQGSLTNLQLHEGKNRFRWTFTAGSTKITYTPEYKSI